MPHPAFSSRAIPANQGQTRSDSCRAPDRRSKLSRTATTTSMKSELILPPVCTPVLCLGVRLDRTQIVCHRPLLQSAGRQSSSRLCIAKISTRPSFASTYQLHLKDSWAAPFSIIMMELHDSAGVPGRPDREISKASGTGASAPNGSLSLGAKLLHISRPPLQVDSVAVSAPCDIQKTLVRCAAKDHSMEPLAAAAKTESGGAVGIVYILSQ